MRLMVQVLVQVYCTCIVTQKAKNQNGCVISKRPRKRRH